MNKYGQKIEDGIYGFCPHCGSGHLNLHNYTKYSHGERKRMYLCRSCKRSTVNPNLPPEGWKKPKRKAPAAVNTEMTITVKIELDDEWINGHSERELVELLRDSYTTNLGYRAAIKKFEVLEETK